MPSCWDDFTAHLRELETIRSIGGLLAWDQQVNLPVKGGALRARQSGALSQITHKMLTDSRVGEWLEALEASDLDDVQSASVRETRRDYDRATRMSPELVAKISQARSNGFQVWLQAKQASDFSLFAPALERLLDLSKESAAAIDASKPVYDVLLDNYDPGITSAFLKDTFSSLREGLVELIGAIEDGPKTLERFQGTFSVESQRKLNMSIIEAMGYDLTSGRLDISEHPFTVGIGDGDVRITTHLYPTDVFAGLGGTMHEAGHALYEQGLPRATLAGTGLSSAASLGVHESQSRFWENYIGRSEAFFQWMAPLAKEYLGPRTPDARGWYESANRVRPGLIRIYADEVTYNLHIIARFELELALLNGELALSDVEEAWIEKYRSLLGVVPEDSAEGVLQDVHWAQGIFGYFPSYTLGNLYASSFAATLQKEQPNHMDKVREGDFSGVLSWLREKVHLPGSRLEVPDLIHSVVGERDHVEDLLAHLWGRQGELYGLTRP